VGSLPDSVMSLVAHPVDAANESLGALGYSSLQARVFSVFDASGECAILTGALVGEQFVSLRDLPSIIASLPPRG
jgi:hypothetical protein